MIELFGVSFARDHCLQFQELNSLNHSLSFAILSSVENHLNDDVIEMVLKLNFCIAVWLFLCSSFIAKIHCNTIPPTTAVSASSPPPPPPASETSNASAEPAASPAAAAAAGRPPNAFQAKLIELESTYQRYSLPTTEMPAAEFKNRTLKVLSDFAQKFRVLLPPKEVLVRRGIFNDTFTHRFGRWPSLLSTEKFTLSFMLRMMTS